MLPVGRRSFARSWPCQVLAVCLVLVVHFVSPVRPMPCGCTAEHNCGCLCWRPLPLTTGTSGTTGASGTTGTTGTTGASGATDTAGAVDTPASVPSSSRAPSRHSCCDPEPAKAASCAAGGQNLPAEGDDTHHTLVRIDVLPVAASSFVHACRAVRSIARVPRRRSSPRATPLHPPPIG